LTTLPLAPRGVDVGATDCECWQRSGRLQAGRACGEPSGQHAQLLTDLRERGDRPVDVLRLVRRGELDADAASPFGTTGKKKPFT
jgi:hypothetical protein